MNNYPSREFNGDLFCKVGHTGLRLFNIESNVTVDQVLIYSAVKCKIRK